MAEKALSKSHELKAKLIFSAFEILKENGGELNGRDLMDAVESKVDLDDWARHVYEKTGNTRWKSILHFASIACVKAGYLVKKKGVWFLTSEGESALSKGEMGLYLSARDAFRAWKRDNKPDEIEPDEETIQEESPNFQIDQVEQLAIDGLKDHVKSKNPYEFQDLSAALLRGMGYYTPYVSPRGKDGGLDIIAYKDPLGTISPRIKVQVKHRPENPSTVQEIRQLMGLLQKDGDIGIFISSGGFTADAKATARSSNIHVELIDMNRFLHLWQDFYHKLADEDKSLLPLLPVYFLAPEN